MYEDNLYLSNLYDFLEEKVRQSWGKATIGLNPQDGIRFENVSFTYPGSSKPALTNISLHLKPGEKLAIVGENGSGKTTLIKLLTRLYTPDSGRIFLDGLDLQEWDVDVLRRRIGVIFQNFVRYQFTVGENIGVGDVEHLENKTRWQTAAEKGMAQSFIDQLPQSFQTQLGRWFKGGQELSGGQWQKIALSRAFMRSQADILVLDEPTSAIDAQAEFEIFNHFRAITQNQMVLLISHRFSTVRMADQIVVIENGEVIEQGTHEELLQLKDVMPSCFCYKQPVISKSLFERGCRQGFQRQNPEVDKAGSRHFRNEPQIFNLLFLLKPLFPLVTAKIRMPNGEESAYSRRSKLRNLVSAVLDLSA